MGSYEETYLARRPQELCHMCGRCCRVVTTQKPYKDLKRLAELGDAMACEFLKIFEPYPSIEAARKVDRELVDNIIERLSLDGNFNEEDTTFYRCKYLLEDNLCSIYEERPVLCRHCPSTPWSIVPPGCGFEGCLFLERERAKEKIRRSKEELRELKLLKKRKVDEAILKRIEAVEHKINTSIELYKKYGSYDW